MSQGETTILLRATRRNVSPLFTGLVLAAIAISVCPMAGAQGAKAAPTDLDLRALAKGVEQRRQVSGTICGSVEMKEFVSDAELTIDEAMSRAALARGERVQDDPNKQVRWADRSLSTLRFAYDPAAGTWAAEMLVAPESRRYDSWGGFRAPPPVGGDGDGGAPPSSGFVQPRLVSWCDGQRQLVYDSTGLGAVLSVPDGKVPEYVLHPVRQLVYTADDILVEVLQGAIGTRLVGKESIAGHEAYKVEQRVTLPTNSAFRRIWICPELSFCVLRYELCSLPSDFPTRGGSFHVVKYTDFYQNAYGLWSPRSSEQQGWRLFSKDRLVWRTIDVLETPGIGVRTRGGLPLWTEWSLPLGTTIMDTTVREKQTTYEGGLSSERADAFGRAAPPVPEQAAAEAAFAELLAARS
jgi:hypothetical protein